MNLDGLQLSLSDKTWSAQGNSSTAEDNSEEMEVLDQKHYQVLASTYGFSRDVVLVYASCHCPPANKNVNLT